MSEFDVYSAVVSLKFPEASEPSPSLTPFLRTSSPSHPPSRANRHLLQHS